MLSVQLGMVLWDAVCSNIGGDVSMLTVVFRCLRQIQRINICL